MKPPRKLHRKRRTPQALPHTRSRFRKDWAHCCACSLCETRFKIALYRGQIPCQVLFVGEAPGPSENVLGKPFVGPAGTLLNDLISEAAYPFTYAVTNAVCCYPGRDATGYFNRPTKEQVRACAPRFHAFLALCRPSLLITLGALPRNHLLLPEKADLTVKNLPHPAKLLRIQNIVKQELEFRRCVHQLNQWTESLPLALTKRG